MGYFYSSRAFQSKKFVLNSQNIKETVNRQAISDSVSVIQNLIVDLSFLNHFHRY